MERRKIVMPDLIRYPPSFLFKRLKKVGPGSSPG